MELESFIGLLATLSIATERLVEIVKGVVPWINEAKPDPKAEGQRRTALHCLAVVAGMASVALAQYCGLQLPDKLENLFGYLAIGILVSGGSGFWNGIVSYIGNVKDVKKAEARVKESLVPPLEANTFPDVNLGDEQMTSNECFDVEDK